jgi:flagellin
MSNITLTAGIRQNLLSLQNTSANLTTTQERLSTGKKVNTAFDNPTSYFTSQALTNRANDLSALLDQIGQAQQTLQEANNGLTSLTSLLEQALSTAQQAQQSALGTVNYSTISGTTAIANDTTQVLSTATVANAVTAAGVTASVQSNVNLNAAGIATLASGDTLVYTLGAHTVTATFGTADTTASNTFSDAAGLISVLNAGAGGSGNLSSVATALTDGSGGVTVYSNDVSTDFATSFTSAHLTANPADFTTTAHTLGSALTLNDGTHNASFYYVAQNANAADGTFTAIGATTGTAGSLLAAISNAASSVNATITPSNPGTNGYLQLAAANNVGITVSGALGGALGFSSSQYKNNYNAQLASINNDTLTVQVGTDTHTISFGTGANQISSKTGLTALLGTFGDINGSFNSSNDLVLTPTSTSTVTIGGDPAAAALFGIGLGGYNPTATVVTPSSTRSTLQTNFNNLLTQINQLASDSSYNGINLLNNNNLQVVFNETNTSSLQIQGVNDQSGGLGLTALNNSEFQDNNSIGTVVTAINTAITTVRAQTQTFGANSGTIQTRQSFEQNTINTLQTGSSNLVLADQNQESANLLTLQTQQQLEISALSIANQANQSVLKLFP